MNVGTMYEIHDVTFRLDQSHRPTMEQQLRASDQAPEDRQNGNESDGSSDNDYSVNDFLASFDF